jgi:hypothetical protein
MEVIAMDIPLCPPWWPGRVPLPGPRPYDLYGLNAQLPVVLLAR